MGRIHVCDACVAPCDDPESQMVVPSLYRHLSIYILFSSRFTSYNKNKWFLRGV
jgi:hypothetical protein